MKVIKLLVVGVAALLAGTHALAQLRSIPKDAKPGEMRHVQGVLVDIDGKRQRLAPGAQIRDPMNRIVLPSALPPDTKVRYQLDAQGEVRRVWILTPEEAAQR